MRLQFPEMSGKLTDTEQKILEFIEENREEFLFMTIGQLAEQMRVSEATVSRFARHLGCRDFKQVKAVVMEQNHLEGPAGKMAGTLFQSEKPGILSYLKRQQICLEKTMEHLDEQEFEAAIQEIISASRVHIYAKNASSSMGQLLFFRMRRLGIAVSLLPSGGSEMLEGLASVKKDDLVILFGFSKISKEGRIILEQQKTAGYHTLLFTSRLHAPKEDLAHVNLYVYRGQAGEYHSMTAAAAVTDALIIALSDSMGAEGAKNLHNIYKLKKKYQL